MTTTISTRPESPRRRPRRAALSTVAVAAGVGLLASGCSGSGAGSGGSAGGNSSPTPAPSSKPARSSPGPSSSSAGAGQAETIATARTGELGTILVDDEGRTVYLFEKDEGTTSSCYGQCAAVWPPVTIGAKPKGESGATASKLATTKRRDGAMQVTYNGHPLYYYTPDNRTKGSTKGQDIEQFGAEWYVLSPAGEKVEKGGS